MIPGLVHNISAASSTSRAAERGAFPKPFNERFYADDPSTVPCNLNPSQAIRISAAAAQAMRVQSRLIPTVELVSKAAACADRRASAERTLFECSSSGSDHEPSSVCLAAMVNEFMENECACGEGSCAPACRSTESCDSLEDAMSNGVADIFNSLQRLACCRDDREIKLLRDVQAIVESTARLADDSWHSHMDEKRTISAHNFRKRIIMTLLQSDGYDAAICKTRWDDVGGIPGGDYEFIDVLFPCDSSSEPLRLIVDIDFQAQFEIARPSSEFSAALRLVSPIFVGRLEKLQQIVHLMAEATKRSLRIKGLHLPPWRKLGYMKAKWFSSYKRTMSSVASSSARKQATHFGNGGGFKGIAVRGFGLDSRYTNEFEIFYYGSKLLPQGSKDLPWFANDRDERITVSTTNWQPPPVAVRSHSINSRKQGKVTGLASMLRHPTNNAIVAKAA